MLSISQKQKLRGEFKWDNHQHAANFNKNMRRKLKQGIKGLSDMVLLLENLPPRVLENVKLIEDLPKVLEFVEAFVEKAEPLPVAEHESGELRIFRNYANCVENHPNADAYKTRIKKINGKIYLIDSINLTASPAEIHCCDVLKKHIECLQQYIDPSIVVIDDSEDRRKQWLRACNAASVQTEINNRKAMMGRCDATLQIIKEEIPTKPPCKPHVLIDGKIHDIPINEEESQYSGEPILSKKAGEPLLFFGKPMTKEFWSSQEKEPK